MAELAPHQSGRVLLVVVRVTARTALALRVAAVRTHTVSPHKATTQLAGNLRLLVLGRARFKGQLGHFRSSRIQFERQAGQKRQ